MEEHTRGCDVNQEEIINVNMELKPIPPTDSSTSNIIKVKYSIQVSKISHYCDGFEIKLDWLFVYR